MTAIFAIVDNDYAAVGADTMRSISGWGSAQAAKAHVWDEGVLLAQAGEGMYLTELIFKVLEKAPYLRQQFSGFESDIQFIEGFKHLQGAFLQKAQDVYIQKHNAPAMMEGTVLVAACKTATRPGRIHVLDFVSNQATLSTNVFETSGTNQGQLNIVMSQAMGANKPRQLDHIAHGFVGQAAAANPQAVGFPGTVILSRESHGERVVHYRQLISATSIWLPEFQV